MKKCTTCGEKILQKEARGFQPYTKHEYKCISCGEEYVFRYSIGYYIASSAIYIASFYLFSMAISNDWGKQVIIAYLSFYVFIRSLVYFKANGFLVKVVLSNKSETIND